MPFLARAPSVFTLGTALLACVGFAGSADACSACGCGDPTITTMGTQQPFQGRARLSALMRYRTDNVGEPGVDQTRLSEFGLDLSGSYAPWSWLQAVATVPLLRRSVTYTSLAEDQTFTLGDVEVFAKAFVYRDRTFAPHHLLGLLGGMRFPTAPIQRDARGQLLSTDAQPGLGAYTVMAGASYAFFSRPWASYVSATAYVPLVSRKDLQPGTSFRASAALQYQPFLWGAVRLGVDGRLDRPTHEDGRRDPDSGGFIGFLSPALLFNLTPDLTLEGTVRVPVLNRLDGYHREGPVFTLSLTVDLPT